VAEHPRDGRLAHGEADDVLELQLDARALTLPELLVVEDPVIAGDYR
jgi:hypothetical protein